MFVIISQRISITFLLLWYLRTNYGEQANAGLPFTWNFQAAGSSIDAGNTECSPVTAGRTIVSYERQNVSQLLKQH